VESGGRGRRRGLRGERDAGGQPLGRELRGPVVHPLPGSGAASASGARGGRPRGLSGAAPGPAGPAGLRRPAAAPELRGRRFVVDGARGVGGHAAASVAPEVTRRAWAIGTMRSRAAAAGRPAAAAFFRLSARGWTPRVATTGGPGTPAP